TLSFCFSSRSRHTRFSRDWIQTCALPIWRLSKKPKMIRAPYRKRDGDLHPLVFPGWDMLVNENTMPVGPGYQFQAIIKDKRYDRSEERRVGKEWRDVRSSKVIRENSQTQR